MSRLKLSELTAKRVVEGGIRRITNIGDSMEWNYSKIGQNNLVNLRGFENKHKGERCFIICNGPSLKNTDLDLIKDSVSFCMNRIYLHFDQMSFLPNYHVVTNELILEQFTEDLRALPMPRFFNWNRRQLFQNVEGVHFMNMLLRINEFFSENFTKGICSGGTVTFATLQLAYFMGFKEVVIIGMDHNFVDTGIPSKTEVRNSEVDENHFHKDYFPKGKKWQLPDLPRSELAYAQARMAFEKDGRRIIDATIGGKCTIFEKIDYRDYMNESK